MRSITKKVWNSEEWINGVFYELPKTPKNVEWLRDNYGYPQYSITWWKTVDSVWVADKIYTHWVLCE